MPTPESKWNLFVKYPFNYLFFPQGIYDFKNITTSNISIPPIFFASLLKEQKFSIRVEPIVKIAGIKFMKKLYKLAVFGTIHQDTWGKIWVNLLLFQT